MPAALSVDDLNALAACWEARRIPIRHQLRPGVRDAAAALAELGVDLVLPLEARSWWEWHDGADLLEDGFTRGREMGPPGFEFLPLADAAALCLSMRSLSVRATEGNPLPPMNEPSFWWEPTWFPLTRSGVGTVLVVDCASGPEAPSPIRAVNWWDAPAFRDPISGSVGEMVRDWVRAFDQGHWGWDSSLQRWQNDLDKRNHWNV